MAEKELLYKELAYEIVGCFYEVYNTLGPGHKEQIYHKALALEFKSRNIQYDDEKRLKTKYKDEDIGAYAPDIVIEDKIIVEIKSVTQSLKVFEKQLYYYLSGIKYKLGYLINFGTEKIDIRRRVHEIAKIRGTNQR
jgi:GxxExxY protein